MSTAGVTHQAPPVLDLANLTPLVCLHEGFQAFHDFECIASFHLDGPQQKVQENMIDDAIECANLGDFLGLEQWPDPFIHVG